MSGTSEVDFHRSLGLRANGDAGDNAESEARWRRQVRLELIAHGFPAPGDGDAEFAELAGGLIDTFRERARLLGEHRCAADRRIEGFLQQHFGDLKLSRPMRLPVRKSPARAGRFMER